MNRLIKISILLVFAVAICMTSGKVFNIEIGTKSAEKITELGDSTACFADIVENFSYYEYTADKDCYLLYDKSEKLVGKALFSMPYCADIKGYAGNVPLVILLSPDNKVQKVHLLDNNETPSFLDRVVAKGFLERIFKASVPALRWRRIASS